jgi:hypothetical protein
MESGESRVCSSRSGDISRILGVFIWPSMMTCETCISCGPNSLAMDCASALIRAIEQERKQRELEEVAERLEALEEVLKGRRKGA